AFKPLYYRLSRGADIACLIFLMQSVLRRHGTVGNMFSELYRPEDVDIGPTLERFVQSLRRIDTTPIYGAHAHPRGLVHFLSAPSKGSACKRLNLYLRWMVRPAVAAESGGADAVDGLDFGLWKQIPPSKLVIALDTHVLRISRYLGLTRRKTGTW